MARTEIDPKLVTKLAGIVKREPGNSERFYSEKSGIPMPQILRYLLLAELEADPKLKIPASGAAIKKARESGLRWPRVAARAGISVSEAQRLFEEHTGTSASDSYTGRGRKTFESSGAASPSGGRSGGRGKPKPAAKPAGTSGRRRGAAKPSGAKPGPRRGRGTRASARRGAANPS